MGFPSDDTIVAVSTPPGRAGIALVRISGPIAFEIGAVLGLDAATPRTAFLGVVHDANGRLLDRVLATRFEGPRSYTGEDVIEISCHGGALVPALVIDAACCAGARVAKPGEFTKRAYVNGKVDLIQAEATLDLIDSTSVAHHASAMSQLRGVLSHRVESLRERLLEVQAAIGYDIDFPEEDDGPMPTRRIVSLAKAVEEEIKDLLRHAPEGVRLRRGVLTVIAGGPNVGKSSLFNMLQGYDRSIVTETPGTTRDAIEADITIEGYPFTLVDTAGVRDEAELIEKIGIEIARGYLERADVIMLCVEHGQGVSAADLDLAEKARRVGAILMVLETKADLKLGGRSGGERVDPNLLGETIAVSAISGEGLPALRAALIKATFAGLRSSGEPALVTRQRHIRALESAQKEVKRFSDVVCRGHPMEIANTHLVAAADGLESLIGVTDVEDLLESIFVHFCVGK